MRTLWVEGSPKGAESLSSAMTQACLDAAPDVFGAVERFSVWDDDMVLFGRDAAVAKFAPLFGEPITVGQREIWNRVLAEIDRVRAFDRLVISSPMWNWHVPHALKAWIDIIVQPLASFTVDGDGAHVGTLGDGRPAQFVLTRSSAYDGRHPELQDFQRPYLEYVFGMLGYTTDTLVYEPTTRWTAGERAEMRAEALASARRAGAALTTSG